MTKATLVLKTRTVHQGGVVEMVVWQVPLPVPPSDHAFKYRLVYIQGGTRIVGYDNERGKGDHKHLHGVESSYTFKDIDTLLADFMSDVEAHSS